ncbi:hypothetical protein H6P81_007505 [Aristolochia fimbriata]|uniref:Protein kinase domain-containing protein n=1 Tax=Aristolochia fimbriata TaxID=158543 RepID=A0AAV7F3A4_ARIFI|nr:hypothetical protein H6P81_007505 [Aristolochia fimbriata]
MLLVEILAPIIVILLHLRAVESQGAHFAYNGFREANLVLGDIATVTQNGLLRLTNNTLMQRGRGFYGAPLHLKNSSSSNNISTRSFSTAFVSAIVPEDPNFTGHGLAFVISPSVELPGGAPQQYLGIFNLNNNGNSTNHIFAIEHDTATNEEVKDINSNHVGIDINGLVSNESAPAAYFSEGRWINFTLSNGKPIQTWIEYDGISKQITVTVAPIKVARPQRPLLSATVDLAPVLLDPMYVGFSASNGQLRATHYILGWSYSTNGRARPLDLSSLPALPRLTPKPRPKILTIGLPIIAGFLLLAVVSVSVITIRRKIKYSERFRIIKGVASGVVYLHEEWEQLVLHRDVKASNVLLDGDLNGKVGDFGLARLYDHGAAPKTTHVVGTIGYLAPELTRTRKATTSTDVFAFGVFMLEVATGRRPVQYPEGTSNSGEEVLLREWVYNCWKKGSILEASDPKFRGAYIVDEIELVLKLGLVCSNPVAGSRPQMRQVIQILEGREPFKELVISSKSDGGSAEGYGYSAIYFNSSKDNVSVETVSAAESLLSGGR